MTKHFKFVLLIRFIGYLTFIIGLIGFTAVLGPLAQAEVGYRFDQLFDIKHTVPNIVTSNSIDGQQQPVGGAGNFGAISASGEVITPESTEFGIVIEKINANAKVIANVNPANE